MSGPAAAGTVTDDLLVEVACPVCGQRRHRRLLEKQAHFYEEGATREHVFRIVRCRECGVDYVNPRLRSDLIAHHYAEHDLYADLRDSQLEVRTAYFRQTLISLRQEQRRHAPIGAGMRLLDVACSEGTFIALAREEGWQAEGVEISAPAAAHGRTVLGLRIRCGTLEEAAFSDDLFDVVTIQSFLEHSEAPLALLQEAFRIMAPGGLLHANVCNGRSLAARTQKASWYNYDPVVHLVYFSPQTMARVARQAGFVRVRTRSRGVGARFFQTSVSNNPASRAVDSWYQHHGHSSSLLITLKRGVSQALSAAGLGQTLILTARKPPQVAQRIPVAAPGAPAAG